MADKVDHNINTIDGRGTFHGMGIIATVTPGKVIKTPVPRLTVTAANIAQVGQLHQCVYRNWHLTKLVNFHKICDKYVDNPTSNFEVLWKTSVMFCKVSRIPNWMGMMQFMHRDIYPGRSEDVFLPMINTNPTDQFTIYIT